MHPGGDCVDEGYGMNDDFDDGYGLMSNTHPTIKAKRNILSFFKKKDDQSTNEIPSSSHIDPPSLDVVDEPASKSQRVEPHEVDGNYFERDPGLRRPISTYPVNQRDDVRRSYIYMGPCQPKLEEYPRSQDGKQYRRFQYSWFTQFPWLEYSEAKDRAFCFPCFLFDSVPSRFPIFTVEGFKSWKRINGDKCAFMHHVGVPCSPHNIAMRNWENLRNPSHHIDKVINAQSSHQVLQNRLRLKTTIGSIKWLAMQACAFRGHDESIESSNRGNFIELIKYSASLNEEISEVVLEKAPGNAKYTSPLIQKEILNIIANKVRNKVREEVGDAKFCILVDEALDQANKEQMAIVLRFVDSNGFIRERFFAIVGVDDTTSLTLKMAICNVLARYNLQLENLRGQGYDGASNMRGAWNGLQALFLKDCPYAYYVHCFAHRLQLALVAASKDVHDIWLFFSKLGSIINLVSASPKRHSELKSAREIEIADMVASGERDTGRGANQIRTLQRPGATRWSSHFGSINKLIDMFSATCTVLTNMSKNGLNNNIRGEAMGAFKAMRSFEFVFILLLLNRVMGITDVLCQSLQHKSQDILNALNLVSTTKTLLHKLRQDGWDTFIESVSSFCEKNDIDMPEMSARHLEGTRRSCQQYDYITVEHHYRVDIFNATIDFQLVELDNRFTERAIELLILSTALDPSDGFKSFNMDHICSLAEKFYPQDFSQVEINTLRNQLVHYELDVLCHTKFRNMSSLSELCRGLVETRKTEIYFLIDRLIRLVLTLPVSTATTERAFSAMKLVKTTHRNKMEDEFLADCMIIYIERELAENIDSDSIIDDFYSLKNRRAQLQ